MNKQTAKLFAMIAVFAILLFAACKKEEVKTVAPVASFTISPNDTIYDVETFTFTNTSTGADTYVWSFGDGTTSTATSPTKGSYAKPVGVSGCFAPFTITLTATKEGKSTTTTKTVVVNFCS